jgi:hypothetical protein
VTMSGADADCACANAGAPARIAAASTARTIATPFYRRRGFAREGLPHLPIRRLGFGAMQPSGPGMSGPPKDRAGSTVYDRDTHALL